MLAQNKTPQTNATINALLAIFFRFFMPIPPVKIIFYQRAFISTCKTGK